MGSKTRIISHICDPIVKNKHIKTVVDLFAGTGSVGYAIKPHKNVISNDIEYYAYIINQAILNGCEFSTFDEASFWTAVEQQYALIQTRVSIALSAEMAFLNSDSDVDYKQYKTFCENTPSVFTPKSEDPRMSEISNLVSQVEPGNVAVLDFPCLFLTYYANAYFGIAQCCQIDAIRSSIEQIEDSRTKNVLLAVLMSECNSFYNDTFCSVLKSKE